MTIVDNTVGCEFFVLFSKQKTDLFHSGLVQRNAEPHKNNNYFKNRAFLLHGKTAPSGPGPPYYQGFTIALRHTALGTTPLDG